jgi:hypothetical protein
LLAGGDHSPGKSLQRQKQFLLPASIQDMKFGDQSLKFVTSPEREDLDRKIQPERRLWPLPLRV